MTRRHLLLAAAGAAATWLAARRAPGDAPPADLDVTVVGSGPAGLAAAWAAARAGASVLVIEKSRAPGGAGGFAGNVFGAGSPWQPASHSAQAALDEWGRLTGGDGSDPQVAAFVAASSGVLRWLVEDLGSQVACASGWSHGLADPGRPVRVLLERLGSRVWTGCAVVELERGGDGVWVVLARDTSSGESVRIRTRSVVLASGGFARRRDRILADRPELAGAPLVAEAGPGSDGGGLDLLEAADVLWHNRGRYGVYVHSLADPRPGMAGEAVWLPGLESALIVDRAGRRPGNEADVHDLTRCDALAHAPGKRLLALFPAGAAAGLRLQMPPYRGGAAPALPIFPHLKAACRALGGDAAGLQAAVETYDAACAARLDAEHGKPQAYLRPFGSGPLGAVELAAGAAKAFTGARTLPDGRLLARSGQPIPGLYGAGEAIGMLGTPAVGRGFEGSVAACWHTGLTAGRAAAEAG